MLESLFRKRIYARLCLTFVFVLGLIFSASPAVLADNDDVLAEIRTLIQDNYVEPVSADVLNAPTVEETIKRLGDPYTEYFSPQEYMDFTDSIDMQFTGIGVHFEMEDEGVRVVSIIAGSPAEEIGLQPGDLIIESDGQSLAGLSANEASSLIKGAEGTAFKIRVQRGTETRSYTITRRIISEPMVTGKVLDGHIGYVDLNTFGSDVEEFATVIKDLRKQNVDSWIVDIRDNTGGYLISALDIAGYFVGPEYVFRITDRVGNVSQYKALDHGFTLDEPLIFLINGESASASELLAAAVKDYRKGTLIGTTTYGKGSVQTMFQLSSGGILKLTVNRFYSPYGRQINEVGVSPDAEILTGDSLKAAVLLLSTETDALAKARTTAYWGEWEVLADYMITKQAEKYARYYPGYRKVSELSSIPLDKKFTVTFNEAVNWQSVHRRSLELIDSETGERTPIEFEPLGPFEVRVIPEAALEPNKTYWLVIHPLVRDLNELRMAGGALTVVHTVEELED